MRKRSRDQQELVIRQLLDRLAAESADLSEAELRRAARLASSEGRSPEERPQPWRPLRLRWVAAATAALLLATALGFDVAERLTPEGSARSSYAGLGLGFLPSPGWTVVQAGVPGSSESTKAIAANVPLQPADPQQGLPLTALQAWPPWGIVIVASLSARGDPERDAAFPVRTLPLHFANATPVRTAGQPVLEYVLRAGVGGYNIDASVNFASEPTEEILGQAEDQIARLVVASAAVTIAVRPTIQGHSPIRVFGAVSSGKKDEQVTVQYKQCGLAPVQFRDDFEVTTEEGGGWSVETAVGANGVFRAVSRGETSNEVQVLKRVDVRLAPRPPRRYQVQVVERMSFWRKRVLIQRYDRRLGRWIVVKRLRLEHSGAPPGSAYVWSETDDFTLDVPKGANIRAVVPGDQARPCHVAGYSTLLRA